MTSRVVWLAFLGMVGACAELEPEEPEELGSALAAVEIGDNLDPDFATGGRYQQMGITWGKASHVFDDGSLLIAGQAYSGGKTKIYLVKLGPDGWPDSDFGFWGFTTFSFQQDGQPIDSYANSIVFSPGGFFVGGFARTPGGAKDLFAVARFYPSGQPDPSFGTGGAVLTDFPTSAHERINDLQVWGDTLVAVGVASPNGRSLFAVAQYHADGSLDTSFDGDGRRTIDIDAAANAQEATAVSPGPFGVWFVAGNVKVGTTSYMGVASVKLATGALDPAFSGNGKLKLTEADGIGVNDIVWDPRAMIKVAGWARKNGRKHFMAGHVHVSGDEQLCFARVVELNGTSDAEAVGIYYDPWKLDRVVVGGRATLDDGTSAVALTVHHKSIDLDKSFHNDGRALVSFPDKLVPGSLAVVPSPVDPWSYRAYVTGAALGGGETGVAVAALKIRAGKKNQPCMPRDPGAETECQPPLRCINVEQNFWETVICTD